MWIWSNNNGKDDQKNYNASNVYAGSINGSTGVYRVVLSKSNHSDKGEYTTNIHINGNHIATENFTVNW